MAVIIAIVAAAGGALARHLGHAARRTGAGGVSGARERPTASRTSTASGSRRHGSQLRSRGAHGAAGHGAAARDPYGPLPAAPVLALGAVGSVPPGMGVVEGGHDSVQAGGARQEEREPGEVARARSEIKCYLPGVPRATYMPQPFQILQSPSAIFFAYQYAGAVRNVYLKDPGPAPVDSWMGQSVARLGRRHARHRRHAASTTARGSIAPATSTASNCTSSSATRAPPPDVISYEATMEDPQTFTRPWKISMPLYRRLEKNAQLMDFKCVEFVEELLYGQWRKKPLTR